MWMKRLSIHRYDRAGLRRGIRRRARRTPDLSKPPAVSVIVPLFNKRGTIERTIASILAQTCGDFELIVMDDGSTDGGAEFVEAQWADPRIAVLRQANAGPGAARNAGLALAAAPLVTFLDADDEWRPELLARGVATLHAHPACAAFTAAFYNEPEGVDRWSALTAYGFREGPWRLEPDTPRQELRHCADAFHPTTAIYRKEIVADLGGYYTKARCTLGEDVYLWIQILLHHPIYRCMQPLAHYHMEDSQLGIGGRRGRLPLEPVLTDPDPIRESCPPALRDTLELWLGYQAVRAGFMQLDRGDPTLVPALLTRFPRTSAWGGDFWKLRARLAAPGLWRLARSLRGR